jgi:probable phosphoglycerate mutase
MSMTAGSTPPLRLYLVRHGQTDGSKEDRFCGQIDIPLNDTGHAMARALADHYATERWEAIYCSPKLRARQTAAPLAGRLGMTIQIEEDLREIDYGLCDGMLASDVRARYPDEYARWAAQPAQVALPGGETAAQIARRAMSAVDAIRRRHSTGNVMAVAHKATIRILVCALLEMDIGLFRARIGQPVGSVTIFEFKPSGPLLKRLGDQSHLPPDLRHEVGT